MPDNFLGFRAGESLGQILGRHRGIGPGFDILRVSLASILLIIHAKVIGGGSSIGRATSIDVVGYADSTIAHFNFTRPIWQSLVPAFFALSGFLVMASAFRLRVLSTFLAHRVLRIVPALLVEVTLSAVVLGAFFTSLPLDKYFSDPGFFRYFGNIFGFVTLALPGVFENNDNIYKGVVNANLWTLPSEFQCYLITALLLFTGAIYNRKVFTIVFVAVTFVLTIVHYINGSDLGENGPYPGYVMVYYFFVGVLFFHYQERIPAFLSLFIACAIFCYVTMNFGELVYLVPLPLTYCTLFIGVVNFPKFSLISSGDYSYGVYLYGFPISQAYACLFPHLTSHQYGLGLALFIVLAGTTTFLFAALSWHLIEKRVLAFKKNLPGKFFPSPVR